MHGEIDVKGFLYTYIFTVDILAAIPVINCFHPLSLK
jgi:hypothetical protein